MRTQDSSTKRIIGCCLRGRGAFAAGLLLAAAAVLTPARAQAPAQKPNILVIMGDDIGWSNIGVYNQGIMAGRTPNLDRLANEGMRFTDYYAEASCTGGACKLHHR
jgi:hypothetical protein